MFLDLTTNKLILENIFKMKILKKKNLGTFEGYIIFLTSFYVGYIFYKAIISFLLN